MINKKSLSAHFPVTGPAKRTPAAECNDDLSAKRGKGEAGLQAAAGLLMLYKPSDACCASKQAFSLYQVFCSPERFCVFLTPLPFCPWFAGDSVILIYPLVL
ncbi:hypothetical protein ABEO83_20595 [Bacillus glycinifermentans]|uniref:hypothetical protein n=1 Tax=Bacillus glycinifermentans TaxID=1664069 RepID=UPI003D2588A0